MLARPVFRQKYCVESIPGEGFLLASESDSHVIEGPVFTHLVPLLDGTRTTTEIAEMLRAHQPVEATLQAIGFLAAHGHIHEADPQMPPQFGAFWTEVGADTTKLPAMFGQNQVSVIDLCAVPHPGFAHTLGSFGVRTTTSPASLGVALVDSYLDPRLDELNQLSMRVNAPWLIVKPDGLNIWIGPLFVPGRTACWECLASRLRGNREVEEYLRRRTGRTTPLATTRARLWPTRQQAYAMAATQLVRWMVHAHNPQLESSLTVVETVSFEFSRHPVVRRPQCPRCGDPRLAQRSGADAEREAENGRTSLVDGGERHEAAEVTFDRYQHLVSPITGLVKHVQPSTWHDRSPLRTYVAGHNFAMTSDSLYFLKDGLRKLSSGKGRSDAQARTSALCEALERYSGVHQGDEPRQRTTLRALGGAGIDPNRCMLFSDAQYRDREQWLARGAKFQTVPRPFDDGAELDWTPVYSLTERATKYLPTSYLYYGYPYDDRQFFCWADSNGNAAGRSFDDACLQGLYELIERDSVCLWWYSRVRRPEVDLDSGDDPYIDELRTFYRAHQREFWVLDLTTDVGIPSFVAINRRVGAPTEDIVMGFGAHADPRIAISRALTEMNQFMPAVLDVGPDGKTAYGVQDVESLHWWTTATLANQPYLVPSETRRMCDYPSPPRASIRQRRREAVAQVAKLGHEVLVLDQTRPDIGLTVVKVLAPGLRHFWARFAPGRLYDVPAALGWVERPLTEAELNPIAMFL